MRVEEGDVVFRHVATGLNGQNLNLPVVFWFKIQKWLLVRLYLLKTFNVGLITGWSDPYRPCLKLYLDLVKVIFALDSAARDHLMN